MHHGPTEDTAQGRLASNRRSRLRSPNRTHRPSRCLPIPEIRQIVTSRLHYAVRHLGTGRVGRTQQIHNRSAQLERVWRPKAKDEEGNRIMATIANSDIRIYSMIAYR